MSTLITDEFTAPDGSGERYHTKLEHYPDTDYAVMQADFPGGELHDRVYLNKQQAIKYAKAILRNEGIHAID